jgi:hypothetical protein
VGAEYYARRTNLGAGKDAGRKIAPKYVKISPKRVQKKQVILPSPSVTFGATSPKRRGFFAPQKVI